MVVVVLDSANKALLGFNQWCTDRMKASSPGCTLASSFPLILKLIIPEISLLIALIRPNTSVASKSYTSMLYANQKTSPVRRNKPTS